MVQIDWDNLEDKSVLNVGNGAFILRACDLTDLGTFKETLIASGIDFKYLFVNLDYQLCFSVSVWLVILIHKELMNFWRILVPRLIFRFSSLMKCSIPKIDLEKWCWRILLIEEFLWLEWKNILYFLITNKDFWMLGFLMWRSTRCYKCIICYI